MIDLQMVRKKFYMKKTKKDSPQYAHLNFHMYFRYRYMYGHWDFSIDDELYWLNTYILTGPLKALTPSCVLEDVVHKICLAKRSKTMEEFMEVFKIKDKQTITDYYGLPTEEMDRLVQNEYVFDKMKFALAYMIICDMLLTPITCDCGYCHEFYPLNTGVKECYSQCKERIELQKEKQNQKN